MKVKSGLMAVIILAVIFGSWAATSVLGFWKTTTDKVPVKYTTGDAQGEYNPMDIKGSYDFTTISNLFGIPLEDLGKAFSVEDNAALGAYQVKTLETIWGTVSTEEREVGTDSVRLFVAFYRGWPIEMTDSTGLPGKAVDILIEKGKPTAEQQEFMATHRIDAVPDASGETVATSVAEEASERLVKGATTWKEVIDWGVSQADLETLAGGEIKILSSLIKDDCASRGLEFSSVKTAIQALVDAATK
jgi:hypothetical protein